MGEESKHNVVQDMKIEEHDRRITSLEESVQAMLQAQTSMMTQMEITNGVLQQGFDLMKKLAVGIVGALSVIIGGSQVVM
jgi:hypothetical protein